MQQLSDRDEYMTRYAVPDDWAKLIRKLRWIGMEDEAKRLQQAVRTLCPETREISSDPFITTD